MTERQAIEIDYCPTCRGVWLDRGELDKIIERSTAARVARPEPGDASRPAPADANYYEDRHHGDHDRHDSPQSKRRRSWLGDIFD